MFVLSIIIFQNVFTKIYIILYYNIGCSIIEFIILGPFLQIIYIN